MPTDKAELLLRIFNEMRQSGPLLLEAEAAKRVGRLDDAAQTGDALIAALTRQLEATEEHNRHHPETPFDPTAAVEQLLDALLTRADLSETLADRPAAEALRERAMALAPDRLGTAGQAERKRQRAASLLSQGRYAEAATALAEARDHFTEQAEPLQAARVAADLAELYEWLGDGIRARAEASRTRALIEPMLGAEPPTFAAALTALMSGLLAQAQATARLTAVWLELLQIEARLARDQGDFDTAAALFRLVRMHTEQHVLAAIDFQLARIEVERGRLGEGLAAIDRLEPAMTGLLRPKLGVIRSWRAEVFLRLGRFEEAAAVARNAAAESAHFGDDDSLWRAEWRLARGLAGSGDRPGALAAYRDAVRTIAGLRRAPLGYRLESTFLADKLPLFDAAIVLAADTGDARGCLAMVEQVKSRALTALLTAPAGEAAESEWAAEIDALSRGVDALEYQAHRMGWEPAARDERDRLLTERTRLLERARLADPRWRTLSTQPDLDLAALLDRMRNKRQAALSLYHRDRRIVALALCDGVLRMATRELDADAEAAVTAYHRNLESARPDHRGYDPAAFPGLTADRLLPRALLGELLQSETLVIVPHGALHSLPWAALPLDGGRLLQHCAIGVLPNLACVALLDTPLRTDPAIALLGGPSYDPLGTLAPLPLAHEELLAAADLFPGRVVQRPRIGADATQRAYRELLQDPAAAGGILHLACHGDFVAGDPENSGLLLTDGRLDAADIAHRRIPFDEVVLSACASGHRPTQVGDLVLAGDDIVGLPGAFLEAGARSVLVSITPARDDAALALMTRYYEHRTLGRAPLLALRDAQLAMLDAGAEPHLWAGFSVYGCN